MDGESCEPPTGFQFPPGCPLKLRNGAARAKRSFKRDLSEGSKQEAEEKCGVRWPCSADYVTDPQATCPEGWRLGASGECEAPTWYAGPCDRRQDFRFYTARMRSSWSKACEAPWPVVEYKIPKFSPKCPSRFNPKPAHDDGPLRCARDYTQAKCPVHYEWDPREGACFAKRSDVFPRSWGSTRKQACERIDTRRLTPEMKAAFEKSCHVSFPCMSGSRAEAQAQFLCPPGHEEADDVHLLDLEAEVKRQARPPPETLVMSYGVMSTN